MTASVLQASSRASLLRGVSPVAKVCLLELQGLEGKSGDFKNQATPTLLISGGMPRVVPPCPTSGCVSFLRMGHDSPLRKTTERCDPLCVFHHLQYALHAGDDLNTCIPRNVLCSSLPKNLSAWLTLIHPLKFRLSESPSGCFLKLELLIVPNIYYSACP